MGERSRRHDVGPVVQGLFVFAVLVWALVFLGEWAGDLYARGH